MQVRIVVEYGYQTTVFLGKTEEGYSLDKAHFFTGDTYYVVGEATVYGEDHWICDSNNNPKHEPFLLPKKVCEIV